jgi:hypothetical protein
MLVKPPLALGNGDRIEVRRGQPAGDRGVVDLDDRRQVCGGRIAY